MKSPRTILFRCDASEAIGLGHVSRCVGLAQALRDCGARPVFVTCEDGLSLARLREHAFESLLLPAPPPAPHEPLPNWDVEHTLEAAKSHHAGIIIADHYGATTHWLRLAEAALPQIGVIDDLADRDLSCVDFVLNPGGAGNTLAYHTRCECLRLFGPEYALILTAFREARSVAIAADRATAPSDRAPHRPLRLLITLGGGAMERAALLIEALDRLEVPLEIRLTTAAPPQRAAPLAAATAAGRHAATLITLCHDLAPHALWADLALCGAGATCFELCCVGVPMIAVALAANQRGSLTALRDAGAAVCLGDWSARSPQEIAAHVHTLAAQPQLRNDLSHRARRTIDGLGSARAAQAILEQADRIEAAA